MRAIVGTPLSNQPEPRIWLCQSAGAAAPSGGRELREASDRGDSPLQPAGAADLALPVRRRSGPIGGQGATLRKVCITPAAARFMRQEFTR